MGSYILVYNALGLSWAPRWVSAEVELGRFLPRVAQSFLSVSFGRKNFGGEIFHFIIFCLCNGC